MRYALALCNGKRIMHHGGVHNLNVNAVDKIQKRTIQGIKLWITLWIMWTSPVEGASDMQDYEWNMTSAGRIYTS